MLLEKPALMTKIYKPATLAILESSQSYRSSLKTYFETQIDIRDVWTAGSIAEVENNKEDLKKPDIILLDIDLPDTNGIQAIKKLKNLFPDVRIIMLFASADGDVIYKALCAGAAGYMTKDAERAELKRAVLEVRHGLSYICPSIARKVVEYFAPTNETKGESLLTAREGQVVECIVDGLSYKLIADRLSIKIETVRGYIKNIYRKLQVNSKIEVVRKVHRGEL